MTLQRPELITFFSTLLTLGCVWANSAFSESAALPQTRTLVIIIDDLGNQLEAGRRAIALPGKLNMAILPHTPRAAELARLSLAAGKEVLLHAPMSNVQNKALGPGALTADMTRAELRQTLSLSIDSTPGVRGISNHMGSELTAQRQPMEWIMEELAARGLYYIDSRTTGDSVGAATAAAYGIPHLTRQVFLDNDTDPAAIDRQFQQVLQLADRYGIATAIGHPYRTTLAYLAVQLPLLEAQGYRLALVSEVLEDEIRQQQLAKAARSNTRLKAGTVLAAKATANTTAPSASAN